MRFTKKSGHHYYAYGIKEKENKNGLKRQYGGAIMKLGQLEDIEDELGIDLVTLFKALKYGIWINYYDNKGNVLIGKLNGYQLSLKLDSITWELEISRKGNKELPFAIAINNKDCYGNSWALTKEELE